MRKDKPSNKLRKKSSRKSHAPKNKWAMLLIAAGCVVIIGVCLFAVSLPIFGEKAPQSALVKVPEKATEKALADTLTKYFGQDFSRATMKAVKFSGRTPASRHGAYMIEQGTTAVSAAKKIMRGAQTPVRITINGFRLLSDLENRIADKMDFSADSLHTALTSPEVYSKYNIKPDQEIALFIDDSYDVYWTDSAPHVVQKIASHFSDVWSGERLAKATALGLTPAEVMTICSIADEETNLNSEKGTVAQLYFNRFKKGMRLQADPTVRFAAGDFTIKRIGGALLNIDSPYNTYRRNGLPPGPIRTTSVQTIDAFLDSAPNNYLYMCAKPDFSGGHDFTSDYNTHLANAKRYRQALDQRGITSGQ